MANWNDDCTIKESLAQRDQLREDLGVTSGGTLVEHNIARAYGKDEYGAYLVSTCSCGWQSAKCYNYMVSLRELVKQERKHNRVGDNV